MVTPSTSNVFINVVPQLHINALNLQRLNELLVSPFLSLVWIVSRAIANLYKGF